MAIASRQYVEGLSGAFLSDVAQLPSFEPAKSLVVELIRVRDESRGSELNLFGAELMEAIGEAVRAFGARHVLHAMPMELLKHQLTDTQYEQKSRSWMLLALKERS